MKKSYIQATLVAGGLLYILTAALMLFAPMWFYENIGNYAPYNRHYVGDGGSFTLALGLVLFWALCDPVRYRGMIAIVGLSSLAHAINHVLDDFVLNPSTFSITTNISLFIVAFAILLAAWWAVPQVKAAAV
jgi:hypothetical protein